MKATQESSERASAERACAGVDSNAEVGRHLTDLPADAFSSDRVAQDVAKSFANIEQALSPIVGQRGVAALYRRSLHLAKKKYLWLPASPPSDRTAIDVFSLTSALAQQEPAEAAKGGAAVLEELHALLNSLIGPLLTERLLRPVGVNFLGGSSAQDQTQ